MKLRSLFIVTAVIEAGAGLAMLLSPSMAVAMLIGVPLVSSGEVVVARVAGAALLSLGIGCWSARDDSQSRAARGLVAAMLQYNTATVVLLVYARIGLGLSGNGLWPAVLLHLGLGVWCVMCLGLKRVMEKMV